MEEEKDVYNLPIAAFTFGKNGKISPYYPIQDLKDSSKENLAKSKQHKNNNSIESKGSKDSNTYSNEDSEKRFSFKNIIKKNANNLKNSSNNLNNNNLNINIKNNNFNNNNFIFIDKGDSNSSYLNTILYSISYMKLLNNYLIKEFKTNETEQNININLSPKEKFLSIIKDILVKIEQIRNSDKYVNNSININNIINIEALKDNLSNLFKNKKKFLKSSPDEPLDFLYVIINFLHSLKIKKDNGEVNNVCESDCFSHNYLWVKMLKYYECECRGQSKKILNKNNYFIDIPINLIINKYYKNNMYDINQRLFIYYKQLISNFTINIDCPKLGNECKINKVHYKYILKNFPSYLIFNLENDFFKNNELFYSLKETLKNFVLIPHIFNINSLFDIENNNNDNKNYYELIGIIFLNVSKVYTCMFKENNIFNYYDDNIFLNFNNYYDIILYSIKNGLIPVSIFYENIDLNTNNNNIDRNSIKYDPNYELNKEQVAKLEKYIKNTNSLTKNLKNKIRTSENIISDNYTINYSIGSTNNNNPSFSDYYNNSSRFSGSINSFSSNQKNEYLCNHCERINKIENKICFFCGYDNRPYLTNINKNINLKKQKSNNISHKNSIKKNISLTSSNDTNQQKQNNELGEIEEEYKNIDPNVLKYFDMPRPYIPSHQNNEKISSTKQSPKSNKNKIPFSSNNNKSNNIKNNEKVHLNNPTNILNGSESNTLDNNILSKMDPNFIFKRNLKIIHKKRNSNNDDLREKNYYSELRNNHLNINLKINNNNNYNIFEFNNKKSFVNMEGLEGNEANFTEKKLLKKINFIKNKKLKKFSINNSNSSGNIESNNQKFKFINGNINSNSKNDLNKVNFGIYFQNNNKEK